MMRVVMMMYYGDEFFCCMFLMMQGDVWRVCKMMHDMVQWDLSNGVPVAKIEN